jgi:hypothetical protein
MDRTLLVFSALMISLAQAGAQEWQKFLQGVSVARFTSFDEAVTRMNGLGDPQNSPLRALLEAVNAQTVWDNPGALSAGQGKDKAGFVAWFQRVILRRTPSSLPVEINPDTGRPMQAPMGPIGKAFEGFARLMAANDGPALIDSYFQTLGKLRSRLNAVRTEGEPGPGARRVATTELGLAGLARAVLTGPRRRELSANQRGLLEFMVSAHPAHPAALAPRVALALDDRSKVPAFHRSGGEGLLDGERLVDELVGRRDDAAALPWRRSLRYKSYLMRMTTGWIRVRIASRPGQLPLERPLA